MPIDIYSKFISEPLLLELNVVFSILVLLLAIKCLNKSMGLNKLLYHL